MSARATINSLEVLSLLTASNLYVLCQALDLRALQFDLEAGVARVVRDQLSRHFAAHLPTAAQDALFRTLANTARRALGETSKMDAEERMEKVAAALTSPLVDFCTAAPAYIPALAGIVAFRGAVAKEAAVLLQQLRREYLEAPGAATPASRYLGRTKALYEYVRVALGVRMHGAENLHGWVDGPGVEEASIGQNISVIHEVCVALARL